jgi:hypothetical protein
MPECIAKLVYRHVAHGWVAKLGSTWVVPHCQCWKTPHGFGVDCATGKVSARYLDAVRED